jgi:hypothetical protein
MIKKEELIKNINFENNSNLKLFLFKLYIKKYNYIIEEYRDDFYIYIKNEYGINCYYASHNNNKNKIIVQYDFKGDLYIDDIIQTNSECFSDSLFLDMTVDKTIGKFGNFFQITEKT